MAEFFDELQFVPTADALREFEERLDSQSESDFVATGFPSHDQVLGRLRRGEFALVGARPSMGKTAFMLAMALNQSKAGVHVYFFSLEMSLAIIMARIVSIETRIPLLDIIERRLSETQVRRIVGVLPVIRELGGDWSTEPLLRRIEALFMQIEPRSNAVVYIDFIGMIDVGDVRASDAYAATTQIAMTLKRFAMQYEIPVVAAAQLNRQVETRRDKWPQLSDFRDSGRLEEMGDIVLGLYRPGYYDHGVPDNQLAVHCLKNKNGPKVNYVLEWNGPCARAFEAERQR